MRDVLDASPRCTRRVSPLCVDGLDRPLVLVQQRDRADQRQVLQVIAPGAGLRVEEGQLAGEGVGDQQRAQQPLGVAVELAGCGCRSSPGRAGPRGSARSRCRRWMARVCSRSSSTVSTRQRFSSSSSISIAVVVRKIITGPSTRYSWVTSFPVAGSLPVDAIGQLAFATAGASAHSWPARRLPPRRWPGSCACRSVSPM